MVKPHKDVPEPTAPPETYKTGKVWADKLVNSLPEVQLRVALLGALQFSLEHKFLFSRQFGEYGWEGLERLCNGRGS